MIYRDGSVGAAGQTVHTKSYEPPLKIDSVVDMSAELYIYIYIGHISTPMHHTLASMHGKKTVDRSVHALNHLEGQKGMQLVSCNSS